MKGFVFCIIITCCFLNFSCITNKNVVYLQDKGTLINDSVQIQELNKPYRVQVNDILRINVKALDEELVSIFNPVGSGNNAGIGGQG